MTTAPEAESIWEIVKQWVVAVGLFAVVPAVSALLNFYLANTLHQLFASSGNAFLFKELYAASRVVPGLGLINLFVAGALAVSRRYAQAAGLLVGAGLSLALYVYVLFAQ